MSDYAKELAYAPDGYLLNKSSIPKELAETIFKEIDDIIKNNEINYSENCILKTKCHVCRNQFNFYKKFKDTD